MKKSVQTVLMLILLSLGLPLGAVEMVMDTIREPLFDMVRLDNDVSVLGNKELAGMGIVDVTAAPFGADASGKTDSTKAIQSAIEFACMNQMICFFPAGTYLISDTLNCVEPRYRRQNGAETSAANFPNVLAGSAKSQKERAVIKLAPASPGFADPESPKYVIHFWVRSKQDMEKEFPSSGNSSYSQMLVNIDIDIGENNPGAVGVRNRAAQGSSIQDVMINATHGLKGLEGGAGSGGSHHHVTVIGGEIGVDLTEAQPAPTISGFSLIGQRKTALQYTGMETLSMVGCVIKNSGRGPLIIGQGTPGIPHTGEITMADSVIIFETPGENTAFAMNRSLYLNNVYIKNALYLADTDGKKVSLESGWNQIREYAQGVDLSHMTYHYISAPYVNGVQESALITVNPGVEPPPDITLKHIWPAAPSWETPGAVNVKDQPWGAAGDGIADDTDALQKAIDAHEIVFVPKGVYRITRTLNLQPDTKLIGISEKFSIIAARIKTPFFADAKNPRPMIATADTAEAGTMLAFIGTYAPSELTGVCDLLWRSGGSSVVRSYHASHKPSVGYGAPSAPYDENISAQVLITGHGGGRWYNWYQEGHGMVYGKDEQDPRFRQMVISNTCGPISFYQMNPEGSESYARVEIIKAAEVNIYGLKSEGNQLVVFARDSGCVRIFGYGGNASALPGSSLLRFENMEKILVAGIMPRSMKPGKKMLGLSVSQDPAVWQLITNVQNGKTESTKPLERPVVYRQGDLRK
jgi:hypothetical protein